MAIIKHIKSRNANYSDALEYLLFQHNEKTGKPLLDDSGRKLLREEFYMDGLHCDPMSFDKECEKTNTFFHKNQKRGDIKSHHYIISFDPVDATECGLTGEKAQALCLDFARKNFPGYQALVVTHTDGHNGSGNIHTHIVINSVRKYAVERQDYMDKPHEHEAGFKHRSTTRFLNHLKKEVMEMCDREGLHQVDLLSPAPAKITISAESLGANYGKAYLEQQFQNHSVSKVRPHESSHRTENVAKLDYHADPFMIFFVKSELRLVTDLQTNIKAMQNQAYARKVKISNLQQMADTLIYIQDHGYDTREDLKKQETDIRLKMEEAQEHLSDLSSKMKDLNAQIHYTGQYFASKPIYAEFLKSKNKKKFRQDHLSEIKCYEEARDWLKAFYPDGKMLSMKILKSQKAELQKSIDTQKSVVKQFRDYHKELEIASANVDAILERKEPSIYTYYEQPAQTENQKTNSQHKKKEDKTL